jgi:nucleoside-diphosphate-sugar epimerase
VLPKGDHFNMHVLLTGQEGFTGKYLQRELLAHGHTVTGLQSDLTQSDAIAHEVATIKPEAVIHLGGISFVQHQDINHIYQVNLLGTRNLLLAVSHLSNIQSVILASSGSVYGNNPESVLTEQSVKLPANDYAVSKLSMEYMAKLWMDRLPICITRPFNYTGIEQSTDFLIPKIVSHFSSKKPSIELGNIDVEREFGDVRSVVEIYRKLLEKKPTNKTVNICTGKAYTLKQVLSLCETITGHKLEVRINPLFVRENEVRTLVGSPTHLKNLIGDWHSYSLEETLRWMLHLPATQ